MLNDGLPQIQIALIPVFMKEFQLSLLKVGFLISIPLICGTVMLLFAGFIADRMNHINQMVIALSLLALFSVVTGFTRDVALLAVCLTFIQIGNNLFHPAGFSISSKLMKPEHRTTALGFFNAGGTMGFAFGPFSLAILLGLWTWRAVYFFWALLLVANVAYLLALKFARAWSPTTGAVEEQSVRPSVRSVLTLPFITLISIIGVEWLGRHMVLTYLTSFLVFEKSYAVQTASIFLGLVSVAGIVGGPLGGFLADKFGVIRWFMLCITGIAACTYLIVLSPAVPPLIAVALIFGFFAAGEMASGSSLVSRYTSIQRVGLGYAFYFLAINSVSAVAPLIGALIAQDYGFSSILYVAPLFMFFGLSVTWSVLKKRYEHVRRPEDGSTSQ